MISYYEKRGKIFLIIILKFLTINITCQNNMSLSSSNPECQIPARCKLVYYPIVNQILICDDFYYSKIEKSMMKNL